MKMELFQKNLMRGIGEHSGRYAHALRFAIGLHGAIGNTWCLEIPPNC